MPPPFFPDQKSGAITEPLPHKSSCISGHMTFSQIHQKVRFELHNAYLPICIALAESAIRAHAVRSPLYSTMTLCKL